MKTKKEILQIKESSELLEVIAELSEKLETLEQIVVSIQNKAEQKSKSFFDLD